jgi:hypothetical protein
LPIGLQLSAVPGAPWDKARREGQLTGAANGRSYTTSDSRALGVLLRLLDVGGPGRR